MTGRRLALVVASDEYEHEGLRQLRSPAADAAALAEVLGDATIADFQVTVVRNEPAYVVAAKIEDHFTDSKPDDLLLLHFSCHGLKNEAGELFFAARNTRPDRLGSTAVAADFVQRCMRGSRARRMVLFLDCCYGGAFAQGVSVRASGSANVLESFPADRLGGGRGRAVISASSAMEYAFEGAELAEDRAQPSIFTSALVRGLRTGEADRDQDGLISLNELYDYVFDKVREQNPNQTPTRDVELQGELYLARSGRKKVVASPLPPELAAALRDANMFSRLGAVGELQVRLRHADPAVALGARAALEELVRNDITYVANAASQALSEGVSSLAAPKPPPGPTAPEAPESSAVPHASAAPPVSSTPPVTAAPGPVTEPTSVIAGLASPMEAPGRQQDRAQRVTTSLLALIAGTLILAGPLLPYRNDVTFGEDVADLRGYFVVTGLLALTGGVLGLADRRAGSPGVGVILACIFPAVWGIADLLVRAPLNSGIENNVGNPIELVAHGGLLLAGIGATAETLHARSTYLRLAREASPADRVMAGVGVLAGALLVAQGVSLEDLYDPYSKQTIWGGVLLALVIAVPALVVRAHALRLAAIAGGAVAGLAVASHYWVSLGFFNRSLVPIGAFTVLLLGLLGMATVMSRRLPVQLVAGALGVFAGILIASGPLLPFRYDSPYRDEAPQLTWYFILIGGLAVVTGVGMLLHWPRRGQAAVGLVAAAAIGTWGAAEVLVDFGYYDGSSSNVGSWTELAAFLGLLVAGCVAWMVLARSTTSSWARPNGTERSRWVLAGLGVAESIALALQSLDAFSSYPAQGARTLWGAAVLLAMSAVTFALRPDVMSRTLVAGQVVGCLALFSHYAIVLGLADHSRTIMKIFAVLLVCQIIALVVATVTTRRPRAQPG